MKTWRRSITAYPSLSHRIRMNLCPASTDPYTSALDIRYEPSPQKDSTVRSGIAMAAPHAPPIS